MKLYPSQEPVKKAATYEDNRTTGFTENWSAALGLAISEDLPVTSRMIPTTTSSQRAKKVSDYTASGDIPYSVAQFYGGDLNGLAGYARDTLGLDGFVTDEEYEEQRQLEYKGRRDYSHSVFEKATGMGVVGQMAGYGHAMALDPIYATSFLTGYGAASTVGQAMLRVGVLEAGIEAAAQGPKMSWKEEIGADYSGAQAITEIVFAGVGAGTLAGIGKGLGRLVTPKDLTVGQATEVLETMAKTNPELVPVVNTLKHSAPEENLAKVLEADEAVDIRRATESPLQVDEKSKSDIKAEDYTQLEEDIYLKRQPVEAVEGTADEGTVYHRTDAEPFTEFKDMPKSKHSFGGDAGFYFSPKLDDPSTYVFGGTIIPAKVDIKNPAPVSVIRQEHGNPFTRIEIKPTKKEAKKYFGGEAPEYIDPERLYKDDVAFLESRGYDGVQWEGAEGVTTPAQTVAFRPEQIKVEKEGVPRGTPTEEPKPDLRHPMVKEADEVVSRADDSIKIMEDCF